jgi:signal transduction histidine kinase
MLYLQPAESNENARAERVPVATLTAAGFERALLAADPEVRVRELHAALVRDPAVANWTRQAATRAGRLSPTLDDAVDWLAGCLELELATYLAAGENGTADCDIESRLPVLVRRLANYERRLAEAGTRLERDKLESLKELAYGASHEINNPLANIAARAQTLLDEETDTERRRKLVAIHRQAMRAHEMIADLMLFARPPKLNRTQCDIRQVIQLVVDESSQQAGEQHTPVTWDAPDQPFDLLVDATQLAVAIQALVRNSLEAVGEGGCVYLGLKTVVRDGAPWVEISVRDDGPGISEEIREHVFDPFFSGREAGRGLGFGLSKCWRIVTEHGGDVAVHPRTADGTEVTIRLPGAMHAGTCADC